MALKFNLEVTNESVEQAQSERGTRYTGPTPPPDVYRVKLKKLLSAEDKNGNPFFNAVLEIDEEGDKAIYNGAGIFYRLSLPVDKSYEYYAIQVNVLNDFLKAVSDLDILDFKKLAAAGKILTDGQSSNKQDIVKSIGKFKVEKADQFFVKTKVSTYNGKEYVNVHYIDLDLTNEANGKGQDSISDDVDDDDDDLDLDDLDDILGDD